ncbi:MAG: ABATE domain-containing protein [Anaerolineae bacterium]
MGLHAKTLEIVGGELCLAFADTVDWRASEHPEELLNGYGDIVAWGRDVGVLTGVEAERMLAKAEARPQEADAALRRAIGLREAVYGILVAVADGLPPAPEDLEVLNRVLSEALSRMRLVATPEGVVWASRGEAALEQVMWTVARQAVDLLTSQRLDRVGQCPGCGWLFLDHSRNRSRRWCTMEVCGNRAKARRHYERTRQGRPH